MEPTIRPTQATDVPHLVEMTRETGVFKLIEITALEEVLEDYLAEPGAEGYHCYTCEQDGQLLGFECHGPNTMTDRTWDLYWIVVAKATQAKGVGGLLLKFVEEDIRKRNGRLLVIETSSLPSYEPTRRFYKKHDYDQAATIKDFYADGDSIVIFTKRLAD
jgi:GNAT superfamily N-acetyltransferase